MEILKEIETVDATDERAMFSLNEKVYEWLLSINPDSKYGKFVFSRDALKTIRPEGWRLAESFQTDAGWDFHLERWDGLKRVFYEDAHTEELVELHAIIQAIEYERAHS